MFISFKIYIFPFLRKFFWIFEQDYFIALIFNLSFLLIIHFCNFWSSLIMFTNRPPVRLSMLVIIFKFTLMWGIYIFRRAPVVAQWPVLHWSLQLLKLVIELKKNLQCCKLIIMGIRLNNLKLSRLFAFYIRFGIPYQIRIISNNFI